MPYNFSDSDFAHVDKTTSIYAAFRKLVDSIDLKKGECPTEEGVLVEFYLNGWDVGIELDCERKEIVFFGIELEGSNDFSYSYRENKIPNLYDKLKEKPFSLQLNG